MNKKQLYESIMRSVSYEVKKALNEGFELENRFAPENVKDLCDIINERTSNEGYDCDLNDIDVSSIQSFAEFSAYLNRPDLFNCNISEWDVSNAENMSYMFDMCENFNRDISKWNVANVVDMTGMFSDCRNFNSNISEWNVHNVQHMNFMFYNCRSFNQDLHYWHAPYVEYNDSIFRNCPISEKFKPKFK
ncbi:MAG: hypothetical protein [Wendovervirus sonii]|uniref:BspA family leucine-rich repeat surface protein n=1 Tax=phage Lak_Megaphage_Sonny TaxID=3109229 RepID=A0ABZ0Z406_9CAUD|nr:MAG: hypothetical protein [phage Lak_Megaphage_Sonny]